MKSDFLVLKSPLILGEIQLFAAKTPQKRLGFVAVMGEFPSGFRPSGDMTGESTANPIPKSQVRC